MDYKQRPSDPLFKDCISTSLTEEELAFYLRQAWKEIYNTSATKEQLCILWCHTSLETGRGKFIYNNNFGNIKRREGQTYTSYKCNEILNGKAEWFEPYHPQTFFQSWDSPVEGAKAYLQFLNKKRYQPALEALKEGNISKYCAKLKEGGYFTADLNYYTNLMSKLSKSFNKKSEEFMSFIPSGYSFTEEKLPDSQPATVKEPSVKPNVVNETTSPATTTLPSAPQINKEDKKVEKQEIKEISVTTVNKSKFSDFISQIINLIIKILKGKK